MKPIGEQVWEYEHIEMTVLWDGRPIATLANVSDDDAVAFGVAIAAVPDMVRALRRVLALHKADGRESGVHIMDAALSKAGVS